MATKKIVLSKSNLTNEETATASRGNYQKPMEAHFNKYHQLGLICVTVNLKEEMKPNGVKKVMYNIPKSFKKITYNNCGDNISNENNCMVILTGERSNVIVVDVDNKPDSQYSGLTLWNAFIEKHGDPHTWKVKTANGGYHYYFKYDEHSKTFLNKADLFIEPKNAKLDFESNKYSIDIRTDNGLIYAPPTSFKALSGEQKKYIWLKSPEETPLADIPDELYKLLSHESNLKKQKKKVTSKKKATNKKTDKDDMKNNNDFPTEHALDLIQNKKRYTVLLKSSLEDIVRNLNPERNNKYQVWLELGMALYKFGDDICFDLWDEFSRNSKYYDKSEIIRKMGTFHRNGGFSYPSLLIWLKEDGQEYYSEFKMKYKELLKITDNRTIIYEINKGNYNIAKKYSQFMSGKLIFAGEKWFTWDRVCHIWQPAKEDILANKIACYLKKHITLAIELSTVDKYTKKLERLRTKYTDISMTIRILRQCKSFLIDDDFYDKLDGTKHQINFMNGLYDFKTKSFRIRTKKDYVTKCLPFDYTDKTDKRIMNEINNILFNISNSDHELSEFNKRWLGYCITGETSLQRFLFVVGYSAANGKSTMAKIFMESLPIYSRKLDRNTFSKSFTKAHKQFAMIKKPIRFVCIEELDRAKLDTNKLKDFVDGDKIGSNEVLYGTTEDIEIQAKLYCCSNNDPVFDTDSGVERRGLLEILTNRFVDKKVFDTAQNKEGLFIRDIKLIDKFKYDNDYKMAFINTIIPYANAFYDEDFVIPKFMTDKFKSLCAENDKMKMFIDQYYDTTDDHADRVSKDEFLNLYNEHHKSKYRWPYIISDVKRLLTYDRTMRKYGKRGVILGLKEKENLFINED